MTGHVLWWGLLLTAVPLSMAIHAVMESAITARRRRHAVRPGYPGDQRGRAW